MITRDFIVIITLVVSRRERTIQSINNCRVWVSKCLSDVHYVGVFGSSNIRDQAS